MGSDKAGTGLWVWEAPGRNREREPALQMSERPDFVDHAGEKLDVVRVSHLP